MGGLPTSTINGFAVDPSRTQVMYVATRDGVYRSADAGQNWKRTGPRNVAAVAVHPKRPADVFGATTEGKVFASRDGARTWAPVARRAP